MEEQQYLTLVNEIITQGFTKSDRTGTGTKSLFCRTMRFSLRDGTLPLLTTKKVFTRGIIEELLWFISGDTKVKTLQDKGVHIWDANAKNGDLGPIYGFQWRHFGAEYRGDAEDYTDEGEDQLKNVIDLIKHNPDSRRILLCAWNPRDVSQMALPPCHIVAQFYVAGGELSCAMLQRSADMGLGVPFNIASYALFTHMLARHCGLKAGEFIHVMNDCHVYLNHIEGLKEQLGRTPRDFPKILFKNDPGTEIDKYTLSDFEIVGYNPHPAIKLEMSV